LLAEDLRRNIYLVFKEAVNNLAKYAEASAVKIDLLLEKNIIHLIIKDDGKGFDVTKNTSSNGVRNMETRTSAHKGSLIITSSANEGTCIHASFSIA